MSIQQALVTTYSLCGLTTLIDKYQVGEAGGDIWQYNGTTFAFDASLKTRRSDAIDRSGLSVLYNEGQTISFVYNATGSTHTINASAFSAGSWRCIAHYPGTTYQLLAMRSDRVDGHYLVDLFAISSGAVVKTGTYALNGFDLINPSGMAWVGNATANGGLIYVTDSGQRDHQVQKYVPGVAFTPITDVGRIAYSKTINAPIRAVDPASIEATCIDTIGIGNPTGTGTPGFSRTRSRDGDEVCVDLPFDSDETKELFSGFLPINKIPKGISGRQISVRLRISHNRICSIGSMFVDASGPQARN